MENKNIGIMTWFYNYNYGSALQLVALNQTIRELGYNPIVIQYYHQSTNRLPDMGIFQEYVRRLYNKINVAMNNQYSIFSEDRNRRFDMFLNQHIQYSDLCNNMADLYHLNDAFHAFVCGSDQIWSTRSYDPHYFLDFVLDNQRKIAYAPSLGQSKISDSHVARRMRENMSSFLHISVREEEGKRIILELTGKEAELVVDPTLLFDSARWEKLAKINNKRIIKPYALVYFLGCNMKHWRSVKRMSKEMGLELRIIPVFKQDLVRSGCIEEPIGPIEFLNWIKDASFVFTDSFHGTVFSLIFQKKFCVYKRFKDKDKYSENSRIYSLMNQLNLKNQIYTSKNEKKFLFQEIDYDSVNEILKRQREKSILYLKNALYSVPSLERNNKFTYNINNVGMLCCGCGACLGICPVNAISMELVKEGFYKAVVDQRFCIHCGKCLGVCPFLGVRTDKNIHEGKLYSFKRKEKSILLKSSSGGFAFSMAQMLNKNGYAIIGCGFDSQKQKARHMIAYQGEIEKLYMFQGSKYMQSDISDVVKCITEEKKPMLIFGTPCQIAGLKKLIQNHNVIYIDLICHGVPTYNLLVKYQKYLRETANIDTDGLNIVFRYKPKGWRKKYIFASDGKNEMCSCQSRDPYLRIFEVGNCLARNCYECRWRDRSTADIRIGDYWGKQFRKEKEGVNMVLTLSPKGETILHNLVSQCDCDIKEKNIEDYFKGQQIKNNSRPVYYEELINELQDIKIPIQDTVKKYVIPYEKRRRLIKAYTAVKGILK